MNVELKTLLGSIGSNQSEIKVLLKTKSKTIKKVQSAMDEKARTKTPLNEGQQRIVNELTGLYAKEGGQLQESLMRMEHVQDDLHSGKAVMLSLLLLQRHQSRAITCLRRIIASCERTLKNL